MPRETREKKEEEEEEGKVALAPPHHHGVPQPHAKDPGGPGLDKAPSGWQHELKVKI